MEGRHLHLPRCHCQLKRGFFPGYEPKCFQSELLVLFPLFDCLLLGLVQCLFDLLTCNCIEIIILELEDSVILRSSSVINNCLKSVIWSLYSH